MTQGEVRKLLMDSYPNELNIAQMCAKLTLNRTSISRCCKRLREQNDENIEYTKNANREYRYRWKK